MLLNLLIMLICLNKLYANKNASFNIETGVS
jgi:hypothetical protein